MSPVATRPSWRYNGRYEALPTASWYKTPLHRLPHHVLETVDGIAAGPTNRELWIIWVASPFMNMDAIQNTR
jgi:hypothetical protein